MLTCATCHITSEPIASVDGHAICGTCGDLLVILDAEAGTTRKALRADADGLSAATQTTLRTALAADARFRRQPGQPVG